MNKYKAMKGTVILEYTVGYREHKSGLLMLSEGQQEELRRQGTTHTVDIRTLKDHIRWGKIIAGRENLQGLSGVALAEEPVVLFNKHDGTAWGEDKEKQVIYYTLPAKAIIAVDTRA